MSSAAVPGRSSTHGSSVSARCSRPPLDPAHAGADKQRGHEAVGAAASAALLLAAIVGCMQALVLSVLGSRGLAAWGAAPGSPLHSDAAAYLAARALAAPATVLMLVLQGCFRWGEGVGCCDLGAHDCLRMLGGQLHLHVLVAVTAPACTRAGGWATRARRCWARWQPTC